MGFMPPEQLFNRQLTAASDLYGLGATIISLLTGTDSTDISQLMDSDYKLHFRHLIPPMERGWLNWLEKMVEPNPRDRYKSAASARTALESLDVSTLPKLRLNKRSLELKASVWGERLTGSIEVTNPIPNTILTGKWSVAPHPKDPPHTPYDHSWISFSEREFTGNHIECQIHVDTSKLEADKTYHRQIVLETNSDTEKEDIVLEITTAPPPTFKLTRSFIFTNLGFISLFIFPSLLAAKYQDVRWTIFWLIFWSFPVMVAGDKITMIGSKNLQFNRVKVVLLTAWIILAFWIGLFTLIFGLATFFFQGVGVKIAGILMIISVQFHFLYVISLIPCGLLLLYVDNWLKVVFSKEKAAKIGLLMLGFSLILSTIPRHLIYIYAHPESFSLGAILPAAAIGAIAFLITGIPLLNLAIIQPTLLIRKYRKAKPNLIQTADERR